MRSIIIAVLCGFFAFAGTAAYAQICPGSHLYYIIRDKKGKPIDAAESALSFDKSTGSDYTNWVFKEKPYGYESYLEAGLTDKVKATFGKTQWLEAYKLCNFAGPVKLTVTLNKKVMELTFNPPRLSEYQTANFLVDSLPFKSGKYSATLTLPENGYRGYYPPSVWKKTP